MSRVSVTAQAAERIRQLRSERRWSARQLADECARIGVGSLTRSTIAKIESGVRKSVTSDELAALSKALGVSLDSFVGSESVSAVPTLSADPARNSNIAYYTFVDAPVKSARPDFEAIKHFRMELGSEIALMYPSSYTPLEFLARAHMSVDNVLTRTGALLFSQDPLVACPTAIVKCAKYYGNDRTASREYLTIEGTVPTQITAARSFVADRVRIQTVPSTGQIAGSAIYEYPMIAVREMITNALVHRDYEAFDSCVHVRLYSNRLEVASPGNWYGHHLADNTEYALDNLVSQSRKRNFRLANVLSWIRLVEGEGSGIPSILNDCHTASVPAPTVVQQDGFVTITLYPRGR
jgi:transcriptional regulator with XRE-family HTH domain